MKTLLLNIDTIHIKARARCEIGNIPELMDSIRKYGLLHPITVTDGHILVAGYRRLEAAKRLGWKTIPCTVLPPNTDAITHLNIEITENTNRKDFSDDEISDALMHLHKLRNPHWLIRLIRVIHAWFRIGK